MGLKVSGASHVLFESELLLFRSWSSFSSSIRGKPRPTRAQDANFSFSRSASTTGPPWFSDGKTGPEQEGHLKPAGAVVWVSWPKWLFSAFQSKTSKFFSQLIFNVKFYAKMQKKEGFISNFWNFVYKICTFYTKWGFKKNMQKHLWIQLLEVN